MSARLAFALAAVFAFGPPEPATTPATSGFESMQGFVNVCLAAIDRVLATDTNPGSARLPSANGNPVEPGIYVLLSQQRAVIFDRNAATIQDGAFADGRPSKEQLEEFAKRRSAGDPTPLGCLSGCSQQMYESFHDTWEQLTEESRTIGVDVPTRVLIAADADILARTVVESAYAASESRPVLPPRLYLLVGASAAGLRVRPFSLLPPRGLSLSYAQRNLALRVQFKADGRYRVSAADPSFGGTADADDLARLVLALRDVKKRYPGKETVILDVGDARLADVVRVMVAIQDTFPRVVLANGQRVRIG